MSTLARDAATAYAALGWSVVPIPPLAKGPTRDGWQTRVFAPDDFDMSGNVGLKLGVSDHLNGPLLIDVDCDCAEAIALAPTLLPSTTTFGRLGDGKVPPANSSKIDYRRAGPRRHWIYRCTDDPPHACNPKHVHCELRSQSRRGLATQTMAPGSVHPDTHEVISWVDVPTDADGRPSPTPLCASEIERLHRRLAIATLVARMWLPDGPLRGQRHDACLAFAGTLWHAGWTLEEARAVLLPAWSLDDEPTEGSHREQAIDDTWRDGDQNRWGMPSLRVLLDATHRNELNAFERLLADKATGTTDRGRGGLVVVSAATVQPGAPAHGVVTLPPLNDEGNAAALAAMYGDDLRHVEGVGWMRWDPASTRWVVGGTHDAAAPWSEAIDLSRRYAALADSLGGDAGDKLRQWSIASGMLRHLKATLQVLACNPAIARGVGELDANAWLLGTPTGVVDLCTGMQRAATREDLITRCTAVGFDADAPMPERFGRFLAETMSGSDELAAYLLRYLGHVLTGDTSEDVFAIWHGATAGNGKSTLLGVIQAILGDYACTLAPGLLIHSVGSQHPAGLMDLRGRRFAYTSETGEGQRWNEALIKQLTGGDNIRARPMYGHFVEFRASAKIVVATNSRPVVRESGGGFWRRVHLLPWLQSWIGREDRALDAQLERERPGILRWLVHACVEWQRTGLQPPLEVRAAGDDYRQSQDTLGTFLRECVTTVEDAWLGRPELFAAYRQWCETGGEHALGRQAFARTLQDRGWVMQTRNGARGYKGVRLLPGAI